MTRTPRLGSAFETLEDRSLPTAFGVPWADPGHLTLSFAPDGTTTPLGPNTLAQMLGSAATPAAWKVEILRAFQTWAVNANINIGLVADGGQALGSVGAAQGDARFGDIRIAAGVLSPELLASAAPFSFTGSTLGGDVVLNGTDPFGIGPGAGYDLYSVLLHEAGHVFGFDHTPDGTPSALHAGYQYQTGLSAADVAELQALYGTRQPDAFEGAGGNDTAARASAIPRVSSAQLLATGDITTASDVDFYKFTAPAATASLSSVTVRLKAAGLSLLTASVTVYDAAGNVVASGAATDPLNNDLVLTFRPGLLGGNYTVKVAGARNDVFGIGGYKLAVDFLSVGGLLSPVTTALTAVADGHTDDLLSNALGIQTNPGADNRFDAVYRGVIEDTRDVDTYRVRTDKYAAGTPVTLDVMAWATDANPLDPRVKVFDAAGNPVAFQVLSNDRGLFSVQVLSAVAGQNYFVQVSARAGAVQSTGSYVVAADFNQLPPLVFDAAAGGMVAPGSTTDPDALTLTKAGMFQFALAAQGADGDQVTMTVYDGDGNVVFTLTAVAGQAPVTATKYLNAGTYTVRYSGTKANKGADGYGLFLARLSEGVGAYTTNTASAPSTASGTTATDSGSGGSGGSPGSGGSGSGGSSGSSPTQPTYSYSGDSSSKPSSGYFYTY